ncbi:MAG: DUF63 family protein [Candidatus Micrarchaeota archaeon]
MVGILDQAGEFLDEYFVQPMAHPEVNAPYNLFNTAAYALIALLAAYLIWKYLRQRKIPITNEFYFAILPFIFMGGIMRVIQDGGLLPRGIEIAGITIYPFISPGIYILMFAVLAAVYFVSTLTAGKDFPLLLRKIRDSGIGLTAALFAILALWGFNKITPSNVLLLGAILLLAFLGSALFEFFKTRFYNKRENKQMVNMERTAVFSQLLDGAATFIGVSFAGYSEQHVVANTIFSLGSPFAFFLVKLVFAFALIFALRKEASSREEQIYVLALITIFGLAPGVRDALRLFFSV